MREIVLTQGKVALVDDDTFALFGHLAWSAKHDRKNDAWYARRTSQGRTEYLHHFIVGRPAPGHVVDHINGDGLDNRRENLRVVTFRQNQQNRRSHRNGRLPGVTVFHVERGNKTYTYWGAAFCVGGKRKFLGTYATETEAHAAYLAACPVYPGQPGDTGIPGKASRG